MKTATASDGEDSFDPTGGRMLRNDSRLRPLAATMKTVAILAGYRMLLKFFGSVFSVTLL